MLECRCLLHNVRDNSLLCLTKASVNLRIWLHLQLIHVDKKHHSQDKFWNKIYIFHLCFSSLHMYHLQFWRFIGSVLLFSSGPLPKKIYHVTCDVAFLWFSAGIFWFQDQCQVSLPQETTKFHVYWELRYFNYSCGANANQLIVVIIIIN